MPLDPGDELLFRHARSGDGRAYSFNSHRVFNAIAGASVALTGERVGELRRITSVAV